jgi:hypothetical protein
MKPKTLPGVSNGRRYRGTLPGPYMSARPEGIASRVMAVLRFRRDLIRWGDFLLGDPPTDTFVRERGMTTGLIVAMRSSFPSPFPILGRSMCNGIPSGQSSGAVDSCLGAVIGSRDG